MVVRRAKSLLKRFVSPVLDGLGVYDRQLRKMPADCWTIVMYHRVIDDPATDPFSLGMCVTRRHFEEQLGFFQKRFTPIGLLDAVGRVERGEPLPPYALSITFDDGYLDNHDVALPVLKAHGLEATLFVPTGGLDDGEPLWWDRVIRAFDATAVSEIEPASLGAPMPEGRLSLGRWRRAETAIQVMNSLWDLPIEQVDGVVARLEKALPPGRDAAPLARRMSPAQLLEMRRHGVEIGAHSVRHPNLKLESAASIRHEMRESKRILEALCDAPIRGFAYPGGRKNADAVRAAREVGFSYAVATTKGINHPGADLMTLARVGMPDTPVSDLKRPLASIVQQRPAVHHDLD